MDEVKSYSLFYCAEDGKIHIGESCTEENESLVGKMTDAVYPSKQYQGEGLRLTLQDFSFQTSADIALIVPHGTQVYLKGVNELKVINDREQANTAVLYSDGDMSISGDEDGVLRCYAQTSQGLWSRCICARFGNLSIEGGTIYAIAGDAKKCSGIYAGGRFREVPNTGRIKISGGRIYASAKTNAIRASEGKLELDPQKNCRSVVVNAMEYAGSSKNWSGDTLTQKKTEEPVSIMFDEPAV